MAIDTKSKRMSLIGIGDDQILPEADGSVIAPDRSVFMFLYSMALLSPVVLRIDSYGYLQNRVVSILSSKKQSTLSSSLFDTLSSRQNEKLNTEEDNKLADSIRGG